MEAQRVGSENFSADSDNQRAGRGFRSQGETGPTWLWQCAAILSMLSGAVAGAVMVHRSVALPPLRLQQNERRVRVRRISDRNRKEGRNYEGLKAKTRAITPDEGVGRAMCC